jgi:hypothetical protein
MIVEFITQEGDGSHRYVGHVVCRGPSTIVLLLTEPFNMAGHTVQFRISEVMSEVILSAP